MHTTLPTLRRSALALCGLVLFAGCATGTAQTTTDRMPAGGMMSERNAMLARYSDKQRQTATDLMAKYGEPDVMSDHMIAWFNKGVFVKTVIRRQGVAHDFPMAHVDYLAQTVKHRVPMERVDEVFEYDGSVYVHRTRGEITAECDLEPMNYLALNLAHDVAMSRRTPADARAFYARTAMAFKGGDRSSPYVNGLVFQQEPNAADPDRPAM